MVVRGRGGQKSEAEPRLCGKLDQQTLEIYSLINSYKVVYRPPIFLSSHQSNTVTVRSIILSGSTLPTLDTYLPCYSCSYLKTYFLIMNTISSTCPNNARACRCASEGKGVPVSSGFTKPGRDARKRQSHKQPSHNAPNLGDEAAKAQVKAGPLPTAAKPTKTKTQRRIFRLTKMLFGLPRDDRNKPARSVKCERQTPVWTEHALARETAKNTERNKSIPFMEETQRVKRCHKTVRCKFRSHDRHFGGAANVLE